MGHFRGGMPAGRRRVEYGRANFRESMGTPSILPCRKVKIAHKLAMQRGKKIAGIILVNPQNPLGTIYSKVIRQELFLSLFTVEGWPLIGHL
jgi:hypothetical protein